MNLETFKVKVIDIKEMQQGEQFITLNKIYDAWDQQCGNVFIMDDLGNESALFEGEYEVLNDKT